LIYSFYDIQLKFDWELEERAESRYSRCGPVDLGRGNREWFEGGDDRGDAHIIRGDRYSPLVFELDDGHECGLALLKEGGNPSAEASHRRKCESEGLVWEDQAYEGLVSLGRCADQAWALVIRNLTGQ